MEFPRDLTRIRSWTNLVRLDGRSGGFGAHDRPPSRPELSSKNWLLPATCSQDAEIMTSNLNDWPSLEDVEAARRRIESHIHLTPAVTSATFDDLSGGRLHFKCENFQKIGAFKIRGALNAVLQLPEALLERGVVTHSSGNHAQAVALAARMRGTIAHIVMPADAKAAKARAVEGYGGRIIPSGPNVESREETAEQVRLETGAHLIHPYNDPHIIAGQGTVALELLDQVEGLDLVLVPVGGGGLASGVSIATKTRSPGIRIIGVEPEGADDARQSFEQGVRVPAPNPSTVADGLRSPLGEMTWSILHHYLDGIVTVSDESIVNAMRLFWERTKIIIEPSAAVGLAAVLAGKVDISGKRVGVILTGGNVDLGDLPW